MEQTILCYMLCDGSNSNALIKIFYVSTASSNIFTVIIQTHARIGIVQRWASLLHCYSSTKNYIKTITNTALIIMITWAYSRIYEYMYVKFCGVCAWESLISYRHLYIVSWQSTLVSWITIHTLTWTQCISIETHTKKAQARTKRYHYYEAVDWNSVLCS